MPDKLLATLLLLGTHAVGAQFVATPLTDFQAGETYLGYPGGLYENNTNTLPADHASDGAALAAQVKALDTNGAPSANGKIVVLNIGMSIWTTESCSQGSYRPPCYSSSLLAQYAISAGRNPKVAIVDCARGGQGMYYWIDDTAGNYTKCLNLLASLGLSEKQVQVVLLKNVALATASLSPGGCSQASVADACRYMATAGTALRYMRGRYPNLKQAFLHSRSYAGFATTNTSPEPQAYEYGFANKWLIQAQINQVRGQPADPVAGDLSYAVAPWLAWGAYFWAPACPRARKDGLCYVQSDFYTGDYTHPAAGAIRKVVSSRNGELSFLLTSPMTPWARSP